MENDIALMASGYVLARIGAIAAFGYLIYRVLRTEPRRVPVRTQDYQPRERASTIRFDR